MKKQKNMELYLFLHWGAITALFIMGILAIDSISNLIKKNRNEKNRTSDQ